MRGKLAIVAAVLLALALSSGAAVAEGNERHILISGSIGGFTPSSDYDDKLGFGVFEWDNGPDITLEMTGLLSQYVGLEVGMHVYGTETNEVIGVKQAIGVFGIEVLAVFQNRDADIQPFGGIGLGIYSNHYAWSVNGSDVVEDDGDGAGLVLKGGVRGFITEGFFLQAFIKAWSNAQEVKNGFTGETDTINLGGTSINIGLGGAF